MQADGNLIPYAERLLQELRDTRGALKELRARIKSKEITEAESAGEVERAWETFEESSQQIADRFGVPLNIY